MHLQRMLTVAFAASLALVAANARGGIVTDPLPPPFTATLTELPPLPGFERSAAFGLNDRGQAVGISFNVGEGDELVAERAVIWTNGRVSALPLFPGATDSRANAIDDVGRVGGRVGQETNFLFRGALWVRNRLLLLPAIGPGVFTTVEDVGNQGIAVGHSSDAQDVDHPVYWIGTRPVFLGQLPGDTGGAALAINARGQIVGVSTNDDTGDRAVLWQNDRAAALPVPPGAAETAALDINDRGAIVGEAADAGTGDPSAVRWQSGVVTFLPTPPGTLTSSAFSINNQGLIVGETFIDDEFEPFFAPTLWAGADVVDLDALIPPGSGWEELLLPDQADLLNNRNQLVGVGNRNGQVRAFLMSLTRVR